MNDTNTGGQAFPCLERGGNGLDLTDGGMTLRDYFAAKAIPSFYKDYAECARNTGWEEDWQMGIALDAYKLADAMLKARG